MTSRALPLVLLVLLALPQVQGDHAASPPYRRDPVVQCITVDYGPPPYVGIGECDKVKAIIYVNGTGVGWRLP